MSTPTSQSVGANLYSGSGATPSNSLINAVRASRPPASTDIRGPSGNFSLGQKWVDYTLQDSYTLCALTASAGTVSATWVQEGSGTGALNQLNGDSGTAYPSAEAITIAGGAGVTTSATGSTVTIALAGGAVAVDSIGTQTGTNPIAATAAGLVTINGAVVAAGTNPVRSDGTGANTMALEVQISQALAATDATKIGLCNFSSGQFAVDANGFVTLAGGGQAIDSFTPDTGTNPVVPSAAGLVTMAGTANQITTTGGLNSLTFSLPSAVTFPGSAQSTTSLTSTTTMVCGTGLTVNAGGILVSGGDVINSHGGVGTDVTVEVTNTDNTNGASRGGFEAATGGASGGDPYVSFLISGAGSAIMGLDNSDSDLFKICSGTAIGTNTMMTLNSTSSVTFPGAIINTTGVLQIGDGNLSLGTAGNKIVSVSVGSGTAAGANSFGTVTLTGGTATVATTAVSASSIIYLTRMSVGATGANDLGILSVGTIVAATSFVINAWTVTNATALQTDDVSVIGYMIVN